MQKKCYSLGTRKYKCLEAEMCLRCLKNFQKAVGWRRMRVREMTETNSENGENPGLMGLGDHMVSVLKFLS